MSCSNESGVDVDDEVLKTGDIQTDAVDERK